MKHYTIRFASKNNIYSVDKYVAALDWISENVVAEIQTGRYGKNPPIHHDERAYFDKHSIFEALIECDPKHIRVFVAGLAGNMSGDFDIRYSRHQFSKRSR